MASFFHWLFDDRSTGRIVIGQWPNAAAWVVLATLVLSFVLPPGKYAIANRITLFVALGLWAIDEVARGANPWRRMLGAATLAGIVVWLLMTRH